MKLYTFFYIILLLFRLYNTGEETEGREENDINEEKEEEYTSPCEDTDNPSSYNDCKQKSTEFIFEVCCFLNGTQFGKPKRECVDVTKDDIRNEKELNNTRDRIKNGTYWDTYNETYNEINVLNCFSNYIFPKIYFLIIILTFQFCREIIIEIFKSENKF